MSYCVDRCSRCRVLMSRGTSGLFGSLGSDWRQRACARISWSTFAVRAARVELRQQRRQRLRLGFATGQPVRIGLADQRIVLQRPLVDAQKVGRLKRAAEQRETASRKDPHT